MQRTRMTMTRDPAILRAFNARFSEIRDSFHARYVAVIPEDEPCRACLALEGEYDIDSVPMLPVSGCSRPEGCTCWYLALSRRTSGD